MVCIHRWPLPVSLSPNTVRDLIVRTVGRCASHTSKIGSITTITQNLLKVSTDNTEPTARALTLLMFVHLYDAVRDVPLVHHTVITALLNSDNEHESTAAYRTAVFFARRSPLFAASLVESVCQTLGSDLLRREPMSDTKKRQLIGALKHVGHMDSLVAADVLTMCTERLLDGTAPNSPMRCDILDMLTSCARDCVGVRTQTVGVSEAAYL